MFRFLYAFIFQNNKEYIICEREVVNYDFDPVIAGITAQN